MLRLDPFVSFPLVFVTYTIQNGTKSIIQQQQQQQKKKYDDELGTISDRDAYKSLFARLDATSNALIDSVLPFRLSTYEQMQNKS